MSVGELKEEALRLSPEARAYLARELLASLDTLSEGEINETAQHLRFFWHDSKHFRERHRLLSRFETVFRLWHALARQCGAGWAEGRPEGGVVGKA